MKREWKCGDRFTEIGGGLYKGTVVAADSRQDWNCVAVIYDVNPWQIRVIPKALIRRLIPKRKPAESVSVTRKKLVEAYAAAVGAEVTDIAEWPVLLRLCKALGLKGES